MSLRLVCGLYALSTTLCCAQQNAQHVVDQGIAVAFSAAQTQRAGEPLSLRFDLSDTASGAPMSGLRPAGWLALRKSPDSAPDCKRQVATYLGGDLFNRPDADLNSFYVLTLNDDASISVVDPLFGFGGSRLLAMLQLESRGADWALDAETARLFVSMPAAGKLAVADTRSWKSISAIATGSNPKRLLLIGSRAWVAHDHGVTAVDTRTLSSTTIAFDGAGDLAASEDGALLFATRAGALVIIDTRSMQVLSELALDGSPSLLAYSAAAKAIYAVDAEAGKLFVVDARSRVLSATVAIRAGATQIRFAPNGRHALIANPLENIVQVLDAASNRIVQNAEIGGGPDRISYTDLLAYVRRRSSEIVAMIPLDQLGHEGQRLGLAEFPGGQHALGSIEPRLADSIVGAPDGPAVLVANPSDKMVYFYKEGMAAPAGGFNTYGQNPQAVLVVDHGLREHSRGNYATSVTVKQPGTYDVVMFVDTPRVVACFELRVAEEPGLAKAPLTRVTAIEPPERLAAGQRARLRFAVTDADRQRPRTASDLRALAFEAPGVWQQRGDLRQLPDGNFEFEFVPPEAGIYYVWIESESLGLAHNNSQFQIYQAN